MSTMASAGSAGYENEEADVSTMASAGSPAYSTQVTIIPSVNTIFVDLGVLPFRHTSGAPIDRFFCICDRGTTFPPHQRRPSTQIT